MVILIKKEVLYFLSGFRRESGRFGSRYSSPPSSGPPSSEIRRERHGLVLGRLPDPWRWLVPGVAFGRFGFLFKALEPVWFGQCLLCNMDTLR